MFIFEGGEEVDVDFLDCVLMFKYKDSEKKVDCLMMIVDNFDGGVWDEVMYKKGNLMWF